VYFEQGIRRYHPLALPCSVFQYEKFQATDSKNEAEQERRPCLRPAETRHSSCRELGADHRGSKAKCVVQKPPRATDLPLSQSGPAGVAALKFIAEPLLRPPDPGRAGSFAAPLWPPDQPQSGPAGVAALKFIAEPLLRPPDPGRAGSFAAPLWPSDPGGDGAFKSPLWPPDRFGLPSRRRGLPTQARLLNASFWGAGDK
jgi:hypothetical protein